MSTEARIVSPQQKIGSRPTGGSSTAPEQDSPKRGKKKLIIVAAVLVVAMGVAWWFLAGPGASAPATDAGTAPAAVAAEPEYELGAVLPIDPISINLAGGRYLRLGFALQLVAGAGGPEGGIDPSIALDTAIALFTGQTQEQLADPNYREELKQQLQDQLFDLYHEEVVAVYYTDFVTQ